MTGFWVLLRKEVLEQRRTWKFVAMAAVLSLSAVLGPTIFAIVTRVRGEPHGVVQAVEALEGIAVTMTFLGTFIAIVISMGVLATERATGTAAMTLSKPVTRSAFVAAKALGLLASIAIGVIVASTVGYVLILILFADGGLGRFATGMVINGAALLFIAFIAMFWSAMFTRQLLAGGLAFATFIVLNTFRAVPDTDRYLPIVAPDWAASIIRAETSNEWPAFGILCGCLVLLPLAAWVIFRRKEL